MREWIDLLENKQDLFTLTQQVRDENAPNFRGNCEGAAGDLAALLRQHDIDAVAIEGLVDYPFEMDGETWPATPHCWVQANGYILDPTVEQFGKYHMIVSMTDAIASRYHPSGELERDDELFEKIEVWPTRYGSIRLRRNPTEREFRRLMDDVSEVRGGITQDGELFMWAAQGATHQQVAEVLGGARNNFLTRLSIFPDLETLEEDSDWSMGSVWEGKGFVFTTGYETDNQHFANFPIFAGAKRVGDFMGTHSDHGRGIRLNKSV